MASHDTVDTIAAIATPPGRGGIGIVRVSGPRASDIAKAMLGKIPNAGSAEYLPFQDSANHTAHQGKPAVLDYGIALYFKAPRSFTGEDVLELQGHGGPVILDMLLQQVISLGARVARPGEFSERAFLNNKLDLAQAEAIADLIDSESQQAARFAMRSLEGEFSRRIHSLVEHVTELRMYVESAIDFPEEEVDFLGDNELQQRLTQVLALLEQTLASAKQGRLLREGMSIVIAGQPNAGKSTLLNQLSGRDSAIVTEIPGTTRDVLREYIQIDGLPLHIIDTAGLRDGADAVEQEGIRRAKDEISRADRILYMIDAGNSQPDQDIQLISELSQAGPDMTLLINKTDIHKVNPVFSGLNYTCISISAKTGDGIEELRAHLKDCVGYSQPTEGGFIARRRHIEALQQASNHVKDGESQLMQHAAGELMAEELRLAQQSLSSITGEFTADDLLGRIFSSFCIGK